MSKMKSEIIRNGSELLLKIIGPLDEDVVLPALDVNNITSIVFDFDKLTLINSCGIRDWISWLSEISSDLDVSYVNCPVILIDQINMVEGLIPPNGKVNSFYIPYFCDECDDIENIKVVKDESWKGFTPQEFMDCSKCNSKIEIDVIESKYFKFLNKF